MASKVIEVVGHLPTLLPDGPTKDPFTEANWTTLLAIMDTVLPSIQKESTASSKQYQATVSDAEFNSALELLKENVVDAPDSKSLAEYLDERPSKLPRFQELLRRTMGVYVPEDGRKGLGFILSALK